MLVDLDQYFCIIGSSVGKGFIRGFIYIWILGDNMKRQIPVVVSTSKKPIMVDRVKDVLLDCNMVIKARVD